MKTVLISLSMIVIIISGCGSARESTKNEPANTTQQPAAENTPAPVVSSGGSEQTTEATKEQAQVIKYRLVISFISIGEGTDPDAREKLNKLLDSWSQKAGKEIAMETYPWGREGEVDFCFHLSELSGPEQAEMTREVRETFKGQSLIQISEYQPSMNKR